MASSETNKELLNLEQQRPCSPESRLLICNDHSLPRNSKKKEVNEHKHESRPIDTASPKSQVLGKVKNFLHEIAQANKQLETKMQENPQVNYDFEALRGDETEIIEMDLLLGVAELQTSEALEAAEVVLGGLQQQRIFPCGRSTYSSDDDSYSDDSEDGNCHSSDSENNDKPRRGQGPRPNSAQPSAGEKLKKRPKIVVLN